MIPAPFDYAAPATLEEALELLDQHGDEARVLTGGHSLIPMMKQRLTRPRLVIDLRRLPALREIRSRGRDLEIGAAVTHAAIARSAEVARCAPLLVETALDIGDLQVRNVGTIGGSIAHADPAADWPAALLAAEATIVLQGKAGERTVPADRFFRGLFETAAKPGEIVTAVRVPAAAEKCGASYQKMPQSASGFALAGVAVCLRVEQRTLADVRIGITGVAVHAFRARTIEAALAGRPAHTSEFAEVDARITEGVDVLSDLHASADYRRQLAQVLARRALGAAMIHAIGRGT